MTAIVAMNPDSPMDPTRCNARNREGNPCSNRAGKGTDHVGFGHCSSHGGKTPAGRAHGAKLAAVAAVPMGGEVDINPLDALVYTVRRAYGLAGYYRLQAEAKAIMGESPEPYASLERHALADLNQWAQRSVGAGVAERMARIAERTGESIAAALEMALERRNMPASERAELVRDFGAELMRLERESGPALPAVASDA